MDLYGGKGYDKGSYTGGEGGFSRVRFTMEQNVEYVIAGLSTSVNAPFVYRKAQLIAAVGGGGDAGGSGNGGLGGGVGVSGEVVVVVVLDLVDLHLMQAHFLRMESLDLEHH